MPSACDDPEATATSLVAASTSPTGDLRSSEPCLDSICESEEKTEALQAALSKLHEKLRAAIVLKEIEGISYEEIAQVLHTSVGSVKSRISRAREALLRLLTKNIPDE